MENARMEDGVWRMATSLGTLHGFTMSRSLQLRRVPLLSPSICMTKETTARKSNGGVLDFEAQLWVTADKLVEARL